MRISDWSSDVCSSDLGHLHTYEKTYFERQRPQDVHAWAEDNRRAVPSRHTRAENRGHRGPDRYPSADRLSVPGRLDRTEFRVGNQCASTRSEEHTSELQSLMRISYAVFCLKKKKENHIRAI